MRTSLAAIFALFAAISGCDCSDPLYNAPPAADAQEAADPDAGLSSIDVDSGSGASDGGIDSGSIGSDGGGAGNSDGGGVASDGGGAASDGGGAASDGGGAPIDSGTTGSLVAILQAATSDLIEIDPATGAMTPLLTLRNPNAAMLLCGSALNGSLWNQVFAHPQDRNRSILLSFDVRSRQIVGETEISPRPGQIFYSPDTTLRAFTSGTSGTEYRSVAANGSTTLINTLAIGGIPICGPLSLGNSFLIYSVTNRGVPGGERLLTIDSSSGAILTDVASDALSFLRKDDHGRILGLRLATSPIEVRRLDPITGTQQPIFSLPIGFALANDTVAIDPSGDRLWLIGNVGGRGGARDEIFTVDLVSQNLTSAALADTPSVLRFVR